MLIYPAIDIYEGKAVRLQQGDYDRQTVYGDRPWEIAKSFADAGFEFIHIVDLEGAKIGSFKNYDVIKKVISESGLKTQVGGGVRSIDDVERLLEAGVERVIVGSIAVKEPETVGGWIEKSGDNKIVAAIDFKEDKVAFAGWLENSNVSPVDLTLKLGECGVKIFLCTDINKDGMLQGPNLDMYKKLSSAFPNYNIIASGGVGKLEDILAIKETGASGAIVGKALYENKIQLTDLKNLLRG